MVLYYLESVILQPLHKKSFLVPLTYIFTCYHLASVKVRDDFSCNIRGAYGNRTVRPSVRPSVSQAVSQSFCVWFMPIRYV